MSPITLSLKNNFDDLMNCNMTLSDKKMYKNDPLYSYYNILCQKDNNNQNDKGQLQIVVSNLQLPIGFSGHGAVLVKLKGKENKLLQVLKHIEEQVAAATGLSISQLVKEPDQDTWYPSFKLKTDKCAVHKDSRGTLQQGCVLERCLITVSRLNHYQGTWYYACYLKSAQIGLCEIDTKEEEEDEESLALLDDV